MLSGTEGEFAGTERFQVRRQLGAGGMGVVYEAFDRERGTVVALKTLRRAGGRSLTRFKNEFRTLQRIEHPNLVSLGELVTDGGQWFFTMELVDGVDLLRYVRGSATPAHADDTATPSADTLRDGPVAARWSQPAAPPCDEARVRACFGQLAHAMSALHAAGVVHRDIKPHNVLVTPQGRVVLLDFGVAIDAGHHDSLTGDGAVVGTAAYMAPEQAHGGDLGPPADWYSFGVVLYEALTGRLPHSGATALELILNKQSQVPPPPRACNPAVPRDLDQLCETLLHNDPSERPTGRQVHARLGIDAAIAPTPAVTMSTDFTQTTPFVGREAELARLEAAFAAMCATGTTRAVYVEGASGMGKSTLLHELADRLEATTRGLVVLEGRCYESELVPYKAFDGVIDTLSRWLARLPARDAAALLPRHASILTRVFPALERVEVFARGATPAGTLRDPHELRARAFSALRELLARLSDRHPLVIVIDDMQWADADSVLLLADLLQPPDPPRMLLLIGARPEDPGGDAPLLRERLHVALDATPIEHVALAPLSAEAGAELARLLLAQHRGDAGAADAIAGEASGHPMFIGELCRYLSAAGASHDHPIVLDEAIAARVATLPADTREILALVCVSEAPLPRAVLAAAARVEPTALSRQIARLRVGFLVRTGTSAGPDWVAPYHARVNESVLAHLDDAARRSAHQRLAAAFESSTIAREAPERLVRHLEAAGEPLRAARHAEVAARRAAETLAFDRAADLYAVALRLGTPSGEARRTIQLALAESLVGAGRGPEAAAAFLAAADGADPATRLACRRQAAEQLIITGHVDRGLETLADLLAEIGEPLARTPRRALASLLWHRARLRVRGLGFRERHATEIAQSELMRTDVLRVVGMGLAMIDTIRGADFNARFVAAALRCGEISRVFPALAVEAGLLASQDARGRRRARAIGDRLRAIAERTGEPYHLAWVDALASMTTFFEGRFAEVAELSARALAMFRDNVIGSTLEQNTFKQFRMFGLRFQGDFQAVRALWSEYVSDARRRGDHFLGTTARFHMTLAWLAGDDVAGAEENLALATWTPPAGHFHLQHWYELEARSELALYAGRAAGVGHADPTFAELERSLLLRVQVVRCNSRWLRARLILSGAGDAPLTSEARAEVSRLCDRLDKDRELDYVGAYAAMGRAALATQAGDADGAARHLRAAVRLADACDMRLQAACARWRLGTLLAGDEGAGFLAEATAAMRRDGVVNPERTVEAVAPGFVRDRSRGRGSSVV